MCNIVARTRPERSLGYIVDTILLFDHHWGLDYKEETREMAIETIQKYGPGTEYEHDARLLPIYRLVSRISRTMTPTELYDALYEKGLFDRVAQFYVDWAETHLTVFNYARAAQIIAHAINHCDPNNHPLLETLRETVEQRLGAPFRLLAPPTPLPPPAAFTTDPARRGAARSLSFDFDAMLQLGPIVTRHPPTVSVAKQQQALQHQQQMQFMQQFPPPDPTGQYRRVLAPIQAPNRGYASRAPPPTAYTTAPPGYAPPFAPAAPAAVSTPPAAVNDPNEFPSLAFSSSAASSSSKKKQQQQHKPPLLPSNQDDSNKENVPPPVLPGFVLPHLNNAPFSPDMISPSLAQMKPGRPNNFILPSSSVFTFADAAAEGVKRGPNSPRPY